MLTPFQRKWGVDQWVSYLKDKEIPVLPRTRNELVIVAEERRESVSPKDLTDFVFKDPYLALKILRQAERHRSRTLGHDTTTALGSVMQAGFDGLLAVVRSGPLADDSLKGLADCEYRAVLSSSIGRHWAAQHADISPEEVALAALLSETGELMLWYLAPELPDEALDLLRSGQVFRSSEAQSMACGFVFKQMTIALIDAWQLPPLLKQLIRGADTLRANVARLATDTARHVVLHPENPAIPADIANIKALLKHVSLEHLLAPLPISDDYKAYVLQHVAEHDVSEPPQ